MARNVVRLHTMYIFMCALLAIQWALLRAHNGIW